MWKLRFLVIVKMQTSLPPPIPDPRETESRRVKKRGMTFRVLFSPVLLGLIVFNLISWYVLIWPALSVGPSKSRVATNAADTLMFLLLGSVFEAATTYFLLSVRVMEDSLSGTNAWGSRTKVAWNEISEVRSFNFLGFRYLKLSTSDRKNVLQLPLYLSKMPKFKSLVALYTTPDNPLTKALAENR